jgi:hypothetical protein
MLRSIILIAGLLLFALPAWAQDAGRVEQLLNDSTAAFKQNNYLRGVSNVQQACTILRHNPSLSQGNNYLDVAANCLDNVKKSVADARARGDAAAAGQRIQALQPLLQSLMEWDRNNPRWHYEKGNLLREESLAYKNVGFTMQAVREFKQALAINGGGAYREDCQRQLDVCQKAVAQGWQNARAWDRAHPRPYTPSTEPTHFTQFCGLCGHTHGPYEHCSGR